MKKKNSNGVNQEEEPELCVISSSSPSIEELEPQELEEEEVKSSNNSNEEVTEIHVENNTKKKKNKNKQVSSENGVVGSCRFPTSRINRIIRSEGADSRITQEAVFLINKATEQFLESFCEDVYANVVRERRKAVDYKHISSVVSTGKRYDFLSDFVPEKIRAEDALSERLAGI